MRPPGGLVTDALDSPMSVRSPQKPLQRSGTPKKVTPAAAYQRAPLNDTLRILLRPIATGLNLLSTLLMTFLSPFLAHFINAFVLLLIGAALLYFLGPRLVHLVTGIPGYLLRGAWSLARGRLPFDLPFSSGNLAWQLSRNGTASAMADFGRGASGAICTVAPFLCSRLEDGEQRLFGGRGQSKGNKVDRAQVARALTKEGRFARTPVSGLCMLRKPTSQCGTLVASLTASTRSAQAAKTEGYTILGESPVPSAACGES